MPKQPPISDADQEFLDALLEQAIEHLEQGRPLSVEAMLNGHTHLRARVEGVIRLAREVVIGRNDVLPGIRGYSILAEIGQGGMGTVYLARQERVAGRLVALKVLPAGSALSNRARERFVREAEAIARLRHPHIITIYDVVHSGGVLAYAMEWVDGSSLAEAIAGEGTEARRHEGTKWRKKAKENHDGPALPRFAVGDSGSTPSCLSIPDICRIGIAIACALAAVHAAGLLHRDVKPSNILLRRDGSAVLTDFGLVREADSTVTQPGHFAGTPAYSAPEQLRGEIEQIDARSDVYSLGVTLYHALAERLPFKKVLKDGAMGAIPPAAMLRLIESGVITPLRGVNPQIPRDLDTIISTAMDPDPARRYQTANDFADDLERLLTLRPIKARPTGLVTRTYKLARRNRRSLAAAVFGAIVALSVGAAAVTYVFFLPGWVADHVREARLTVLSPDYANNTVSVLFWGRVNRYSWEAWEKRRTELKGALKHYDAAIRLAPFDDALRRERSVVAAAAKGSEGTWDDPRSTGLFAFLTQEYETALRDWARYEQLRDPLAQSDPLVDAALGVLYLFDDQASRAYPRLQKAVEAFPNVGFLMEYLADAAAKCGDAERARRWLEESKRLPRRDAIGAGDRINAGILAAEGRVDESLAAYRRLASHGPAGLEMAALLVREDRLDEGLETWLAMAAQFPQSARVQAAFAVAADRWWEAKSESQRRAEIRAVLFADSPQETLLFRVLHAYVTATQRRSDQATQAKQSGPTGPSSLRRFVASSLWFSRSSLFFLPITALSTLFFSPSIQSLSLNELAERLEVENMSSWNTSKSYPRRVIGFGAAALARADSHPARWSVAVAYNALFACALAGFSPSNAQASGYAYFDQKTDTIQVQGQFSLSHATYEVRFLLDPGLPQNQSGEFFGKHQAFVEDKFLGGAANWYVYAYTYAVGGGSPLTSPGAVTQLSVGVWHHLAYCFDGSQERLYLDGQLVASRAAGGGISNGGFLAGVGAYFRNDGGLPNSFLGYLDTIRISSVARYSGTSFIPPCGDLPSDGNTVFLYNFNDPPGSGTVADQSGNGHTGILGVGFTGATGPTLVACAPAAFSEIPVASAGPDQTVAENTVVLLEGTATGLSCTVPSFQWTQIAGPPVAILGGDTAQCSFTAPTVPTGGATLTFQLVVGTSCHTSEPDVVNVHVTNDPPCETADVLQPPAPATVPFGGSVQFQVMAGGTGPLTYQWRKGGVNLTDGPVVCGGTIAGATTDTLVLNTVTFVEAGDYDCVVTNACGTDTSTAATLTIGPPPAAADVNHDGVVNGLDIQALVNALLAP